MLAMIMILAGDEAWPELAQRDVVHLDADSPPIQVAALAGGMTSGKPSVCLRLDLPDGRVVLAETSARLFVSAARVIAARYPGLDDDTPPPG